MRFWKGHALGNDYIVVDGGGRVPTDEVVRRLCDRHRGVGGDGVLVALPSDEEGGSMGLRIFNPDGGEAEKSGNGLRIFGAWLHLTGRAPARTFRVRLPGESVELEVESGAGAGALTPGFVVVRVAMGRASFRAGDVRYRDAAEDEEVLGGPLHVKGGTDRVAETVAVHLVSMGNPHCVIFVDRLDGADLRRIGPAVQASGAFAAGINVQLARVQGPGRISALIWERGAGETQASGSSACAVAAAARRSGQAFGDAFVVEMPGGQVEVELSQEYDVRLRGEAGIVYEGVVRDEIIRGWER